MMPEDLFSPEASRQTLKEMFRHEINSGFLMDIEDKVLEKIGPDLLRLYRVGFDQQTLLTGNDAHFDLEICKCIVGAHHANTVFLSTKEIAEKQKDREYRQKLVTQVVRMVKLRGYAGQFFRRKQIVPGERFAYYPVPYLLYVICVLSGEIIYKNGAPGVTGWYIGQIIEKALASLTLLEDGLLDTAYMPCRAVIELFVKALLLEKHPEIKEEVDRFREFVIEKNLCYQKYPEAFQETFSGRAIFKTSKSVYLNYGFVDKITDYHSIVKQSPYSVPGILQYLQTVSDGTEAGMYDRLVRFYDMCHGYAHGNGIISKYPVLHYMEVSLILGEIVTKVYSMLCERNEVSKYANGIKIHEVFDAEYALLEEQYGSRSTKLLEMETRKIAFPAPK